ncbi:MAG: anti-sigma factor [Deltaproteobacteria bacterium]|nr:anti-sigma factor [Deltaproteobacteria bacterium]
MLRLPTARTLTCALTCALLLPACDNDSTGDDGSSTTARTVSWSFDGLEALGEGYVYEGWLIVDGTPVTAGRFTVDASGEASLSSFEVDAADADAATAFVLTIEPADGDDPAPSATHILAGDFADDTADLSVGHGAALGDDFTAATGEFILAAPTTADNEDDDNQGIWFLSPSEGTPSLDLPALPEGWAYEGWVVTDDGPITTGRFTSATGADSDGAGPTAGPDGFPGFPGQDYIDPAIDLVGTTVVISVEPEPDDSPNPFTLKPLVGAAGEGIKVLMPLDNGAVTSNPTGEARLD